MAGHLQTAGPEASEPLRRRMPRRLRRRRCPPMAGAPHGTEGGPPGRTRCGPRRCSPWAPPPPSRRPGTPPFLPCRDHPAAQLPSRMHDAPLGSPSSVIIHLSRKNLRACAHVFVRRRCLRRVVLMDQDLPHRISSPSKSAPGPRYSLVWKLVLWPREHAACGGAGAGASGRPALPGQQQQRAAGGERSPAASSAAAPGLSRPEWGPPQRIGSAAFGRGGAPLPLDLTAAPPP